MSVVQRVWGWVTGRAEAPSPPSPPPRPSTPEPSESFQYADPAVEKLVGAMTGKLHSSVAARVSRQAVAMQVAQSQTGLAGIALQLASVASETSDRATMGEAALRHLSKEAPDPRWSFGLGLAGASSYAVPRWIACQQTLACQGDLAALGLKVAQAIPNSNYSKERADTGRKALEQLGTPAARLFLKAAATSTYAVPRCALYETFLAQPEGDPCQVAMQALEQIPTQNYSKERAEAGRELVRGLQEGRPALAMALAASQTSTYSLPQRILLEAALENSELQKPAELARLGLAMVRAIPSSNYSKEASDAAGSVVKSLSSYPELSPITGLASAMMNSSTYSLPRNAIADKMLEAAALGTPPAEAARQAFEAIPTSNYSKEAGDAALAAMKKLAGDPIADMALAAMKSSSYNLPQRAIAQVAFAAMTAEQKPTLAQLGLQMVEAIPSSNYRREALDAGKAVATFLLPRYSGARDRLDRARQAGDLAVLKDALASVKDSDDDRASIVKLAEAVTGKAETVTIVQKEDAIIVGGIRVKRRPADAAEAKN